MFTKEELEIIDTKGMSKVYDSWPQIAKKYYVSNLETIEFGKINHIVFAGMGGSGTIGDIFSSILSKENIHVSIIKGYHLPKTVDSETLIVTTSVSGNTLETNSILEYAYEKGIKTLSLSSGGKMEQFCKKNKLDFRKIDAYHSPRASLPVFLFSILKILEPILPIKKNDVLESITELENTCKNISSHNLTETNVSLRLASWINGIPIIYYPFGLQAAAIRFKNSLQENAKKHAFAEDILEATHNGIVAYEKKSNIQPILIQGKEDFIKTKIIWKIIKEFFEEKNIQYEEVVSVNGGILSKLINLIYTLDYTSIYLAIKDRIEPTPVNPIDFVKNKMLVENEKKF